MLGQRSSPAIVGANADLVWKKEPRYDTFLVPVTAPPGIPVIPFFAVPRGGLGSGFGAVPKSISETNMTTAGQIGAPNQFLLHGFAVEPVFASSGAAITALRDWFLLYNQGLFRFVLGQNSVQIEIPLSRIPAGPGPTGVIATALAGTPLATCVAHNGSAHISHYYDFKTENGDPTLLDGTQPFRVELVFAGAAGLTLETATRVRCYLYGLYGSQM